MLPSAYVLIVVNFSLSLWVALILGGDEGSRSSEDLSLNVTCDGPTILGGTTTFVATLTAQPAGVGAADSEDDRYLYVWRDPRWRPSIPLPVLGGRTCVFNSTYSGRNEIGRHNMFVEVFRGYSKLIAGGNVSCTVTNRIPASIISSQNGTVCRESLCNAASSVPLLLTASIHDPSGFLDGSTFLFDWYFGDGDELLKSSLMSVSHQFKTVGQYPVRVEITAIQATGRMITGTAHLTVLTLDAIQNLTVAGLDHVMVGEERNINISCHGSPPVSFCWMVSENLTSNASSGGQCLQSFLLEKCRMVVDYQFNRSRSYTLSIRASNDVSFEHLTLSVDPEAPPAVNPEGIAGAVVAILFGVALTIYSAAVIVRQVQKSRRRHIEVANFNFEASASYDYIREHAKRLNDLAKANEKTPLLANNNALDVRLVRGNEAGSRVEDAATSDD